METSLTVIAAFLVAVFFIIVALTFAAGLWAVVYVLLAWLVGASLPWAWAWAAGIVTVLLLRTIRAA